MLALIDRVKERLDQQDPRPDGYNVGFNAGRAAGQTVDHAHVHVVPRYHGDVEDPRGGVRNVIPGRGNYLRWSDAAPERVLSEPAHGVSAPGHPDAAFLRRVLALVEEGAKVATYKPALLMALVDLSVEASIGADADAEVDIAVVDLADRVMELYWPQVRPRLAEYYRLPDGFHRLRQSTNDRVGGTGPGRQPNEARIPRTVSRLQQAVGGLSPLQVRALRAADWDQARREVATALARQPIPRLQRPGTAVHDEFERFLYDDSGFGESVSMRAAGELHLRLKPGVAQRLADAAPLLRPAIEVVWTRQVAQINRLSVLEENLREQLFGVVRATLAPVRDALTDAGVRDCFWCERRLTTNVQVDHVLPWAHYPLDSLYNLVLTDGACNLDKVDRPVSSRLVQRWFERDVDQLESISAHLGWPVGRARTVRLAATAYSDVPLGFPLWDGRNRPRTVMTTAEREATLQIVLAA